MDNDELMRKIVDEDIIFTARKNIKKAMKKWGIERTEEKIKELYSECKKLREIMLREYRNLLKGEK